MLERAGKTQSLLLGCLMWSLVLQANAQDQSPEKEPDAPSRGLLLVPAPNVVIGSASSQSEKAGESSEGVTNSIGVLSSQQADKFYEQLQQRQAKLREQLADRKQRAQLISERIEQQRSLHPDLAAVLRLDQRAEDKLMALLADQQLSQELQPRSFGRLARPMERGDGKPYNPMRDEAALYTQRMNEIGRTIGAARLDDYVDYQRRMASRIYVSHFEAVLPTEHKLTLEQRNALTELFHDQVYRRDTAFRSMRLTHFDSNLTTEERNRRNQVRTIVSNEQFAAAAETANRELIERSTAILTPEQTQALAQWKEQELARQRAWTQAQRKSLGIAPDENLDYSEHAVPPPLPISKNMQLTVDLTVNDTQLVKQLTSVRGGSISFEAPEGLLVEVRPYMVEQQLFAELKLYEKVRGGRRMVGQMSGSAVLVEPGKPSYGGSGGTMVQGRRGYAINWSVSGAYL